MLESTLDFQVKKEARPVVKASAKQASRVSAGRSGSGLFTAEAKRDFQNAKGVQRTGQFLPFSRLEDSFDVRIDAAKFGAMIIVDKNGESRPVNWDAYLVLETIYPTWKPPS